MQDINVNVYWRVYKHEHNDWVNEDPILVAIFSSFDAAKQKQKELLDQWAKDVCIDDNEEAIVDYDVGIVTFKNYKDAYFKVDIKEFKNM